MTTPTFPTLSETWDSTKYAIELDDSTISDELEGGYTITRARTTRRNRKTWKGGYTFMPDADKLLLVAFWDVVGRARIFLWTNPEDGVQYEVRFKDKLTINYRGVKTLKHWDCDFSVQQA